MQTVYFETVGDRHLWRIGGLTVLERRIREVAKQGTTHVLIATERVDFERALPVVLEFVSRTSTVPEGVRVERADIFDGIELVDDAAVARAEVALVERLSEERRIDRRLAMPITRALAQRSLAVTPDRVRVFAIVVGLMAAALIAVHGPQHVAFVLAGVLLQASALLDGRVLARLRFQYAQRWLDRWSDVIVDVAVIAATAAVLGGVWMWIGAGAAVGRFARVVPVDVPRWASVVRRRDVFVLATLIAGVCAVPQWIVVHAAAVVVVDVALVVWHRRA